MDQVRFAPLGESAIIVDFGDEISIEKNKQILQLARTLMDQPFEGLIETVPTYTTLTIYMDPSKMNHYSFSGLCKHINYYLSNPQNKQIVGKTIPVPVCYDQAFGPDLETIATNKQLTVQQVIDYHVAKTYYVYFLGFSPGFPFLAGLDPRIATSRKETPRLDIPAGSVGIAGSQTGIYPNQSPGGWQIIGRTPLSLLDLDKQNPTLLQPGDRLKFYPITKEAFFKQEATKWD